jgi:hypothetical protein
MEEINYSRMVEAKRATTCKVQMYEIYNFNSKEFYWTELIGYRSKADLHETI